jgi:hypothetical protein
MYFHQDKCCAIIGLKGFIEGTEYVLKLLSNYFNFKKEAQAMRQIFN